MKLLTKSIERKLRKNHELSQQSDELGIKPVLKVFDPSGSATWLFTELDDEGRLFGLCDLGRGFPELGYADLAELQAIRGRFGIGLERDRYFKASMTLNEYSNEARKEGRISA